MGEIFGIGIEELIFIGVLLALLFGPESIPKIARTAGKALNRLFRSPLYREGQQIRKQIQDLPSALARLAELEELQKNLNSEIKDLKAAIDPGTEKVTESIASLKQQAQQLAASPPPDEALSETNPPTPGTASPSPEAEADNTIAPPSAPAQAGDAPNSDDTD